MHAAQTVQTIDKIYGTEFLGKSFSELFLFFREWFFNCWKKFEVKYASIFSKVGSNEGYENTDQKVGLRRDNILKS
jgi:hypothetical protein